MRFRNVIDCLTKLKSECPDRPDIQAEVDLAIQMILGIRPNIEKKYDALLLKLDQTYAGFERTRAFFEKRAKETTLHSERQYAKARVKIANKTLHDVAWMRARNRDLIEIAKKDNHEREPAASDH